MCHLQGPFSKPLELMRGVILSTARMESSLGPTQNDGGLIQCMECVLLTDSDNIAIFPV